MISIWTRLNVLIGNLEHRAMTCWLTMKCAKREKWFSILLNKGETQCLDYTKHHTYTKKPIKFSLHIGYIIEKPIISSSDWEKSATENGIKKNPFTSYLLLHALKCGNKDMTFDKIDSCHRFCLHWAQTFTDYPSFRCV